MTISECTLSDLQSTVGPIRNTNIVAPYYTALTPQIYLKVMLLVNGTYLHSYGIDRKACEAITRASLRFCRGRLLRWNLHMNIYI